MSRFPFPLPNGWFQVAYSDELAPGGVVPLHYFGRELVLFRTEGGREKRKGKDDEEHASNHGVFWVPTISL